MGGANSCVCVGGGGGAPMQALAPGRWRPSVRHCVEGKSASSGGLYFSATVLYADGCQTGPVKYKADSWRRHTAWFNV